MNIRSITGFVDVAAPVDAGPIEEIASYLERTRLALVDEGFTVQTTRLATQPVAGLLASLSPKAGVQVGQQLEAIAKAAHIDYVSLGHFGLDQPQPPASLIPSLLRGSNLFCSLEVANHEKGLSLGRLRLASQTIREVASLSADGFGNLRLAVLANVRPWSPFFPAAYHGGGQPRIALAVEGADLAVKAIQEAATPEAARESLVQVIETKAAQLTRILETVLEGSGVTFAGCDFSLAPYPDAARSVGAALEGLGVSAVGQAGTLAAAAFLTDSLDRAHFKRTGFCGLMLPVLEDSILAARAAEGHLTINDLLVASAVCGTGLDTIPLPGDVSEEQLTAILLDMAALALRLDKQLTARLMPLPGKYAGDPTHFAFEYFAPSRVMAAPEPSLGRFFAEADILDIRPRRGMPT